MMNRCTFSMVVLILIVLTCSVTHASTLYNVTDLGMLSGAEYSAADSINNNGQVVGTSGSNSPVFFDHVFLYGGNGPMQDLNDFVGPHYPYCINDHGQIALGG